MVLCFVPRCDHFSHKNKCKYFRFPTDAKLKNKWIKLLRRKDRNPSNASRICSCHFKDGKKSNGPTIFAWNENQTFQFTSPKGRKKVAERVRLCKEVDTHTSFDFTETSSADNSASTAISCSNIATQTDHTFGSQFYEAEMYFLQNEISLLKEECASLQKQSFGYFLMRNDELCSHFTGLMKDSFDLIVDLMSDIDIKYEGRNVQIINRVDQIFLTIIKLRLDLTNEDLGLRFGISSTTVSHIFSTILKALHEILFEMLMDEVPSQKKNEMCLPNCFQTFSNCRMIIDCTEIPCDIPTNMHQQKVTFSHYKYKNTLKLLIAIAPNGSVTFVSDLYPGAMSDKAIVQACGILKHLKPGDLILADKGFLITDLLPNGVSLNIPPFLHSPKFTSQEVYETRRIAQARVHVERAICRLKRYKILNHISNVEFKKCNVIVQTCAALLNFQTPILKEIESSLLDNN